MAELMDYVKVLADQIGPRPVSTEEEHQASLYIAQELTDDGLDVSADEFATPTGVRWPYAVAFGVLALGTIVSGIGIFAPGISLSMFVVGMILVLGGAFIYYTEYNSQPFLSKMRAGGVSQNVVAKYVPSSVARETHRRKIIIAAHVDTVRVQPEVGPQFIAYNPLLRKIIFFSVIGIVAVTFIRLLPLPWPDAIDIVLWVISLIASIYLLVAAACIVASRFTPYISGGNDNASSISVLLSVARRLLDPEERERYAMERPIAQDTDNPVETFAPQTTGPFEPIGAEQDGFDDLEEPVMHDEDEAYAQGVVPLGAEVEYDDDARRGDATVAFSALDPEKQLDVLADAAADELLENADETVAFSLDDVESQEAPASSLGTLPEIKVPDLDFTLDEDVENTRKSRAEALDDAVIFADYLPKEEVKPEETQSVSEDVQDSAPEASSVEEISETQEPAVAEEPPAPAPVYVPMEAPVRPRQKRTQMARPVPSWYAAAKEKAAKDIEKKTEEKEPGTVSYRSRFADMPTTPGEMRAKQELEAPAPQPDEQVANEDAAAAQVPQDETSAQAGQNPETSGRADVQTQPEIVQDVIDFEIPDDQLDELSPDASGLFGRINPVGKSDDTGGVVENGPEGLTSRIPNIGSSDDKERAGRKAAQEERASHGVRPELQGIPAILDGGAAPAAEASAATHQQRKKPTARHITEQFTPTPAVDARDNRPFGDNRQEAPVSSTYEDTPQATSAFDPFAPKEERYASERAAHVAPRVRPEASGRMPRVRLDEGAVSSSPANTSSFPSLTGSFPALSGSMPVVNADDFADVPQGMIASDEALDNFMAPSKTSDISIPESRFHNAVDKVGGLFGKKKKKGRDAQSDGSNVENWDEDDDFGWKGGGYFEEEKESALDAVRERAAQIRESVVTMTESDLLDKEVWFVALGASGAGGQGMKNFLDLHSSELRGSLIINLEAVGAGKISYIDVEGTGKSRRSDRRLQSLIKKASKELKGSEMKPKSLEWRNTDATPAMIAGMRSITLMGFDENGVAPVNWHCVDDTADIVDEDNLEYVTRLLLKVIENS